MTDILRWISGTFLQWGACVAFSAPIAAIASRGMTGVGRKLFWLAAFFGTCLLLVRSETIWVFLRSPWQSMLLQAVFALAVILITGTAASSGLTFIIDRQAWRDVAFITLLLLLFVAARSAFLQRMGLATLEGLPGWEFILYQATLPGIAEELAYRGVIQSRLNALYPKSWKLFGASLGWGFGITTALFWAMHAFRVEGLALSFHWQTVTLQLIAGFVFGWLRERSGSIFPGVIAHNLVNLVGTIA